MMNGELSDVDLAKQSLSKSRGNGSIGGARHWLGWSVGCANVGLGFGSFEVVVIQILIRGSCALAGFPGVISILPIYVQELLLL